MLYYKLIRGGEGTLAVYLDCRESSYFHTTILCVFSNIGNIIGGFILLHFNCDSEVPAVGTGCSRKLRKLNASALINNNFAIKTYRKLV